MGYDEWTKQRIRPGSEFHRIYNIQPGEYWVKYDSGTERLLFRDSNQNRIIYEHQLNSPVDRVMLIAHLDTIERIPPEIAARFNRGGKSLGSRTETKLADHHIIPIHLWTRSELIKQVLIHNLIDMNERENRMLLPEEFHRQSHDANSEYSQTVLYYLRNRWDAIVEAGLANDLSTIREDVLDLIDALRNELGYLVYTEASINDIGR